MAISSRPDGCLPPFGAPTSEFFTFRADTNCIAATILAAPPCSAAVPSAERLLSTYFVASEFSSFAIPDAPHALRLSSRARGSQVTSLYITLLQPYSWLLVALFAALSFTSSTSLIVKAVDTPSERLTALSLSPAPLLATLCLLLALLTVPLLLGVCAADAKVDVWHRRLGHPGPEALEQCSKRHLGTVIKGPKTHEYQTCAISKAHHAFSRVPQQPRSSALLGHVSVDLFPMSPAYNRDKYAIVMMYQLTRLLLLDSIPDRYHEILLSWIMDKTQLLQRQADLKVHFF